MSQPQPPRWQPPQQPITWGTSQHGPQQPPPPPNWGAPAPRPPHTKPPKNKAGKILGIVAACIVGFFVVALTIGAIVQEDEPADEKPAAKPPAYTVVDRKEAGHSRQITIEVDTTNDLRAVFEDSIKDLTENAGYTILINCSTGGTESVDNRLANGNYAIGNYGTAATGLDDGEKKFELVEGRSCPAK
ncbi:hypothetical protein ACFFKE_32355 [Streptomyces mutabilis]|uniref:hypothetical protein n=1 Tax=Streptomyces mutabilis TaxID=67332 RepID=UPI00177E5FB4|nr:hypothetical protein [Streptomyces mutabilis]GGQ38518.1 hypothetical protein GCM10010279_54780 [Streptomyces mutabilis]